MRRAALLTALTAGLAFAAAPPPEAASDEVRFVFLSGQRPVRVALHLRYGDRPYQAAFQDWAKRFFGWFDADKNGTLSPAEAARLLDPNFLSTIARGGITAGRFAAVPFAGLDKDRDGKVSYPEFLGYLNGASLGGFQFTMDDGPARTAGRTNDAMWKLLDADRDGKLSKEEVTRLPGLLAKLDENEDEYLAEDELVPDAGGPPGFVIAAAPGRMPVAANSPLLSREQQPGLIGPAALRAYDRNGDGKLTREESGLDAGSFARLDADGKGYLDARKLAGLYDLPPDLTFRGVIGPLPRVGGLLDLVGLGGRLGPRRLTLLTPKTPLAGSVRPTAQNAVEVKVGVSLLAVTTTGQTGGAGRSNRIKGFFEQQFDATSGEKKGPLTREQATANQFLGSLFAASDANADGKLERNELSRFLDLIESAQATVVTAQGEDQGNSLFRALDVTGRRQLSLRDLRSAWERLESLCTAGKLLSREDLPRRVTVTISDGPSAARTLAIAGGSVPAPAVRGGGPAWFSKMDLNGDGDVSPKEWLGAEEEFRRLDTDRDGLISAAEAREAVDRTKR